MNLVLQIEERWKKKNRHWKSTFHDLHHRARIRSPVCVFVPYRRFFVTRREKKPFHQDFVRKMTMEPCTNLLVSAANGTKQSSVIWPNTLISNQFFFGASSKFDPCVSALHVVHLSHLPNLVSSSPQLYRVGRACVCIVAITLCTFKIMRFAAASSVIAESVNIYAK